MPNIQKWGSFEIDAAQEEKEELAKSSGGSFLKFDAGRNIVRFMPPPLGRRTPFVKAWQHYIEIPGSDKGVSCNCPRMMAKQYCAVCVEAEKMKSSGSGPDFKVAEAMVAKLRVYANVIARKNPEMGPQIAAFGKMIYEKLLALRDDPDAGGDFTDPEEGFDIVIGKTGEKMNTRYEVTPARQSTPLGDLGWIDLQHDLSRFESIPSEEDLEEALSKAFPPVRGRGRQAAPATRAAAPARGQLAGRGPTATRATTSATTTRGRARTAEDDALEAPEEGDEE